MPRQRKNLVVVRAGDRSYHRNWLDGPKRDFDIAISYYGEEVGKYRADSDLMYEERRGGKWEVIAESIRRWPDVYGSYDAVAFPDDDLDCNAETWNGIFGVFHEMSFDLAQPALTPSSPVFWPHVIRHPLKRARLTNFVEVQVPIFSERGLRVAAPTFDESKTGTGWGIDLLWPMVLYWPEYRMGIIDRWPVTHTRPVGQGTMVQHYASQALDPTAEYRAILRRWNLPSALVDVRQYQVVERGFVLEPRAT